MLIIKPSVYSYNTLEADTVAPITDLKLESDKINNKENTLRKKQNVTGMYEEINLSSPETPKDPFNASDSSNSLYCPSDDKVDLDGSVCSPSVTCGRKTRLKYFNTKNKKGSKLNQNQLSPNNNEKGESDELLQSTFFSSSQIKEDNTVVMQNSHDKLIHPKKKYKRKPDYCYYCEIEVENFGRHVTRNHSTEILVNEILSKPNKSKERRKLLDKLRRQGNFLASGTGQYKAVRQPDTPGRSLLPCDNCLGFFSCKHLYRHRKKCLDDSYQVGQSQTAGQSKLLNIRRVDKRLKEEVFPHMRADKVSLVAKHDTLICAFGARYVNVHREKHCIPIASRKMRELSKILIEMNKLEPDITDMFSTLQPKYFDVFVQAVKQVAKYDVEKDIYNSPTFAMNIVTSLKQCCDIAITYAYKKSAPYLTTSSGEAEANLKTLIHLFETNWRFEVASQAASNLNFNKWNKVTIIPLASDLKLFRQYLIKLAENAIKTLDQNKDTKAYNNLMESVYCRVILLNRKRSGELQRMPLHAYKNNALVEVKEEYEEFNKMMSSAEQILLKTLKRVVIRGKRGRGVPVLFSLDVQEHINTLLKLRDDCVPKENTYFFAKANSLTHILGYKALNKHANRCGAKNPSSITSTRLRKHLATLSQLFNLSENEIEQLATFMGHTPGVHRNSYRLPDDVYQTAKISKLLMIMEKGAADEYKGKTLDEVNIDMDENLLENKCDESDADETVEDVLPEPVPSTSGVTSQSDLQISQPKKAKHRSLVRWTDDQKTVTRFFFKNHIKQCKPPKRLECDKLKEQHPELLQNKNWLKIKVFVQNEYTKKSK